MQRKTQVVLGIALIVWVGTKLPAADSISTIQPAAVESWIDFENCVSWGDNKLAGKAPRETLLAVLGLKSAPGEAPAWTTEPIGGVERHFRIAFSKPVDAGTLCTDFADDSKSVALLKENAAYPGDIADNTQWESLAPGRVKTLPPNTRIRALRFTHKYSPMPWDARLFSSRLECSLLLGGCFWDPASLGSGEWSKFLEPPRKDAKTKAAQKGGLVIIILADNDTDTDLSALAEQYDRAKSPSERDQVAEDTFALIGGRIIPVSDSHGHSVAVKLHRERPFKDEQKAGWVPVGSFVNGMPRHGCSTLTPAPESFDSNSLPDSPSAWDSEWRAMFEGEIAAFKSFGLWDDAEIERAAEAAVRLINKRKAPKISTRWLILTPGELKAFACIGAKFDATAPTAGESITWTKGLIRRLAGRRVIILWDDDDAGKKFRDSTIEALRGHVSDLREMTLGKNGDKKIDANDYARVHGRFGLRAELTMLLANSKDISVKPFDIKKARKELRKEVERAIDRPGTTVFKSVVGTGKSTAVREAVQKSTKKFALVVATHALGKEYEQLDGALRLVSPEVADAEGRIMDETGEKTACPSLPQIKKLRSNGLPYVQKVCANCPLKAGCAAWTQKDKVADAKVLILQQQHLRLVDSKSSYFADRVLVIDESCIGTALRWRSVFSTKKLEKFESFLKGFSMSEIGSGHGQAAGAILAEIAAVKALKDGESHISNGNGERFLSDSFVGAWIKFLSKATDEGANLLPEFLFSIRNRQFMRRGQIKGAGTFWMVLSAIPDSGSILILDATAEPEAYVQVFGRDRLTFWPDAPTPEPQSEVVQFVDGLNPMRTLWDESAGRPSAKFESICSELREIIKAKSIPWNQVGLITMLNLKPFLAERFPEVEHSKMLHYNGLRGRNDLKDCELVGLVGSMHLPDDELAWFAATLFNIDVDPPTMLSAEKKRKAVQVKSVEGDYDVFGRDLQDARLTLASQLTTVAEMTQAIGRARPYEPGLKRQTVLIYSNMPLPMHVSKATTRTEYLESLNIRTQPAHMPERIRAAMQELATGGSFGYEDIAKKTSLSETTLKTDDRYKAAIVLAADGLGLSFIRGRREAGCFTKKDAITIGAKQELGAVPKDIFLGTAPNSKTNLTKPLTPTNSCSVRQNTYLDAVCDQVGQGLQAFFSSKIKMAPATAPKVLRTDFEADEALTA